MKITIERHSAPFGDFSTYRLVNDKGAAVTLSELGAGIIGVEVPDRMGNMENVALAYQNPADYMADGPCMGKIPGRYANRIANGEFELDGKKYKLAVNNGPNHLHGGPTGFQNRIWRSQLIPSGVRFEYESADGEEGYPGKLQVTAEYRWSDANVLTLEMRAVTDRPTVVNLTNHTYWNLDGADAGSILKHNMKIKSSKWLPTDSTLVPLGSLADVDGTPMDFRKAKELGADIKADFPALKFGKGYDNCWAIDGFAPGLMVEDAVVISSAESGRTLAVSTDQPGVQIYTGNWLAGSPLNRSGREYADYDGVAVEAQGFPDAPNKPEFPSQRLNPGETYQRRIVFRFSTSAG